MSKKESHSRSILKAFSWRVVATSTTTTIAYLLTGDVSDALAIGSVEFFAKIPVYYMHERIWQSVPIGSVRRWFAGRKPSVGASEATIDMEHATNA